MDSEFEFTVGSDQDHEDLIAEISHQGDWVCTITQERGFDNLFVQIHPRKNGKPWEFRLAEFELVLSDVRNDSGNFAELKITPPNKHESHPLHFPSQPK